MRTCMRGSWSQKEYYKRNKLVVVHGSRTRVQEVENKRHAFCGSTDNAYFFIKVARVDPSEPFIAGAGTC